jgi:hypothetical protein
VTGPSDEPGDGEDETVDLDEPRPPSNAMEPVQDQIEWEAQGEGGAELDGELNEPRPPSTATDPVQESPASVCGSHGEDASDGDAYESGSEGDGA